MVAVLFTGSSYGPLADPQQRGQPCSASRYRHNTAVTAAGLGFLVLAQTR